MLCTQICVPVGCFGVSGKCESSNKKYHKLKWRIGLLMNINKNLYPVGFYFNCFVQTLSSVFYFSRRSRSWIDFHTPCVFFLIIAKHLLLGLHTYINTVSVRPFPVCEGSACWESALRVKTVDGCSLAFHRGRKHMLPMGTACTGPESLKISVAISLPSFLPSCPVTNMLQTHW